VDLPGSISIHRFPIFAFARDIFIVKRRLWMSKNFASRVSSASATGQLQIRAYFWEEQPCAGISIVPEIGHADGSTIVLGMIWGIPSDALLG
jgi:hypothetical protein